MPSSYTSISLPSSLASTTFTPQTFTTPITLKLSDENYLIWKQQILATVRGFKLFHYLDGSNAPPRFLSVTDRLSNTLNPTYINHYQQDQHIMAWLLASMTTPILTKMVGLETTSQIWQKVTTYYAFHTRAHIKKLRVQLRQSKKDRSVNVYLDIKKIVDSLVAIGTPLSADEHIDTILDRLYEDYNSFITFVTSRLDPYNVEDIKALLLVQEEHFEKHKLNDSSIFQANISTTTNFHNKNKYQRSFQRGGCSFNRGN